MNFKVNINFNVDTRQSLKGGTRKALINHERRRHGYTSNKSINPFLSKYNSYNDLTNYYKAMRGLIMPYIKHHNNLKSVKKNPKRKIKSVHKFLEDRGKRVPYKYIVLKMGNGNTRKKLIELFKRNGYTYKDYAKAINTSFISYADKKNASCRHLAYDHVDTNLDETNRNGGDHAHLGCLGLATTKSGKRSLSFDRATKQEYDGHNGKSKISNMTAWHLMQNYEARSFLKTATPIFQQYLGNDFKFQLSRNPSDSTSLKHDDYVKTQEANDKLRASNKELKKALTSSSSTVKALTERLEQSNNQRPIIEKGPNISQIPKLTEQNARLKAQLQAQANQLNILNGLKPILKKWKRSYAELNIKLNILQGALKKYQKICSPTYTNSLIKLLKRSENI